LKISATGNAIVKALILIELVKRRVGNLYQINHIESDVIKSVEETKIEDMPKVETKRRVTKMDTELSKDPLDETNVGY
jgi:DNA-binding protein